MICKICKKEVDYQTVGRVCSTECEKKENELLAKQFENKIYHAICDESQKLGLHSYKLVKQAVLKAVDDLAFTW
jgi:hypothetical protein